MSLFSQIELSETKLLPQSVFVLDLDILRVRLGQSSAEPQVINHLLLCLVPQASPRQNPHPLRFPPRGTVRRYTTYYSDTNRIHLTHLSFPRLSLSPRKATLLPESSTLHELLF